MIGLKCVIIIWFEKLVVIEGGISNFMYVTNIMLSDLSFSNRSSHI